MPPAPVAQTAAATPTIAPPAPRQTPHQQRVKVAEDGAVLLIDGAVRLVHHNQIKVPHAKAALSAARSFIDEPHHRGVGRYIYPPLGGAVGHQVHRGGVGQVGLEGVDGLVHQRHAVGQKQHALGPACTHEQVHQRNHRAGFARTRGHDHQRLAVLVALKGFGNAANGALLVVALHNARRNRQAGQRFARSAALVHQLQFVFGMKALHRARRAGGVVPHPVFITVGAVDHGAVAGALLQAVGIQAGLLLALLGTAAGALGFHNGQGDFAAPQHIVHKTFALVVGHALYFKLAVALLVQRPARFFEQQVNEQVARGGLVVVVRGGGLRCVGRLGGGNLGAVAGQFRIQFCIAGSGLAQGCVALCQGLGLLRQCLLRCRLGGAAGGLLLRHGRAGRQGQKIGTKLQPRRGPVTHAARIVLRQPEGHMEQLAQCGQGVLRRHGAHIVHRLVAQAANHIHLGVHRAAQQMHQVVGVQTFAGPNNNDVAAVSAS